MMTLVADVFPKLRPPKNVINQISKKSTLIGLFNKQDANGDQTLLES